MATDLDRLINEQLDKLISGGGGLTSPDAINQLLVLNFLNNRQQTQQGLDIATAPRTDANGNTISYDPVKGWQIGTTPATKGVLEAQQLEQRKSLTEDAGLNRQLEQAAGRRALSSNDAFARAFNNYQYETPRSEADFISEDQKHGAWGANTGTNNAAAIAAGAALRGGGQDDFLKVFNAAKGVGDPTDVLGSGVRTGRAAAQQYGTDGPRQKEAAFLSALAGQAQPTGLQNPTTASDLSSLNSQFLSALLSSSNSTAASNNNVLSQLIQSFRSGTA
jgi:hypothetical protein